jgi:hypothetical protein
MWINPASGVFIIKEQVQAELKIVVLITDQITSCLFNNHQFITTYLSIEEPKKNHQHRATDFLRLC